VHGTTTWRRDIGTCLHACIFVLLCSASWLLRSDMAGGLQCVSPLPRAFHSLCWLQRYLVTEHIPLGRRFPARLCQQFFFKKKTETLSLREERRLGLHSLYPGHNTRKRNKRGWRSSLRSQAAQPALQPDQQNKKRREQSSRSLRPQEKKTKCPY
jgi:hypothetical protein